MAKAHRIPETIVQHHVCQLLSSLGSAVYVMGTKRPKGDFQGTRQTPGIPDVMAFVPNRRNPGSYILLFVECKAVGGKLRPEQRTFRENCIAAGQGHVVGGLDDVIAWLLSAGLINASQVPHYRLPQVAQP